MANDDDTSVLSGVLADAVVEWLAENNYLDPEHRPADWNKWRDSLSRHFELVVVDPMSSEV